MSMFSQVRKCIDLKISNPTPFSANVSSNLTYTQKLEHLKNER